jgi:hypothetical protein
VSVRLGVSEAQVTSQAKSDCHFRFERDPRYGPRRASGGNRRLRLAESEAEGAKRDAAGLVSAPGGRRNQTVAVPTGWAPSRLPINPGRATCHTPPHFQTWQPQRLQEQSRAGSTRETERDNSGAMDVYIAEEYVAQRRAERRAARVAAAARCGEEKARADSEQKRRWTEDGKRPADGGDAGGGAAAAWLQAGEDAVLSYLSA